MRWCISPFRVCRINTTGSKRAWQRTVEPIARVQIGNLKPRQVWFDLVRGLPQGLPEAGDRGLDFTPTWGRTYWGGALFCFLADVEIHRRTANAKGLSGCIARDSRGWRHHFFRLESGASVERSAINGRGVPILRELYAQMRSAPHPVDLDQLWHKLGVERQGATVILHEDAPLADVRRAIMPE